MVSWVEEESELSEAELAQLDALVDEDEPEPADGAEPADSPVATEAAPVADQREQPDPDQAARDFLGATDGALWRLAERDVTIEESASFDALVKVREQALAR